MPNAHDKSPANKSAYEAYLTRAVFYEVTGTTLNSLVGAALQPIQVLNFLRNLLI